jgi:enamine deaminase RidA (YjgF/YER057c/UK114 family)
MAIELIDPDLLPTPLNYSHVAIAHGGRLVFVAGQVAADAQPGEDVAAQAPRVHQNVAIALHAAGVQPSDVVKLTTYVVGYTPEMLPAIAAARVSIFGDHRPASTLVGVAALARPEFLIEVEAIAVAE